MKRTGLLVIPLITLLLGAAFAAKAQDKPGEVARIGILSPGSPSAVSPLHHQLREGLRDHGYVDGQNIVIEYRWAEGKYDRLSGLATELVRLKVDLIVAEGTPATLAAKQATTTIPIVIMGSGDPIGSRLVTNLARPGGNITGVSLLSPELDGKRLELLKELVPKLARLAVAQESG